jgi:DUF1009 family protein
MPSPPRSGPLAIIAGAGRLPADIAAEVAARGDAVVVMPLRGLADQRFDGFGGLPVGLLDPAGALAALRQVEASAVVLAGTVAKPGLGVVVAGWQAMRHRDEIRAIMQGGDDNLLRGVVKFLEANGFPVRGVDEVAPGLMARVGPLAGPEPAEAALRDIALGRKALQAIGPLDIGQAVVVAEQRVLAIEAAEGTDAMLRRVATLRQPGLLGRLVRRGRAAIGERGGVMVKAPKPGQDRRVDLPAIGPRTVRLAAAAGLSGIAVEAGGVLLVSRADLVDEAVRRDVFITGLPA